MQTSLRRTLALAAAAAALAASAASAARAQAPANTDVYVAPITRLGDSIVVGRPVNVTHRDGYDNQPAFTADSRAVLYTAQAGGQTDIWRYELGTRRTLRLTRTPESEYSPRPIPGSSRFSVVRVERDSTQRLWSFAADGGDPQLVLAGLKPVGYYAWIGPTTLAAYLLGSPSTLHLVETDGSQDVVLSKDVGRSIENIPVTSRALFSFTQKGYQGQPGVFVFTGGTDTIRYAHKVVRIDPSRRGALAQSEQVVTDSVVVSTKRPYELVGLPTDNEFHAWTPDGVLLGASQSVLQRWSGVLNQGSTWLPVADLKPWGVRNVSRLAVSPDGHWLAFVAEPK